MALLAGWEIFARSGAVTPFMLPAFSAVRVERIYDDAAGGDLFRNIGVTLYRALAGFAIAAIGGIVLGTAMARNAVARWFFDPIISVGFPDAQDRVLAGGDPVARRYTTSRKSPWWCSTPFSRW